MRLVGLCRIYCLYKARFAWSSTQGEGTLLSTEGGDCDWLGLPKMFLKVLVVAPGYETVRMNPLAVFYKKRGVYGFYTENRRRHDGIFTCYYKRKWVLWVQAPKPLPWGTYLDTEKYFIALGAGSKGEGQVARLALRKYSPELFALPCFLVGDTQTLILFCFAGTSSNPRPAELTSRMLQSLLWIKRD